jgi:hypothetical protein
MANILIRSPRYVTQEVPATASSGKLQLTINGTLEYEIIKNASAGSIITFEIAELCRDFIDITFDGNYSPETVNISLAIVFMSGLNGTGSYVSSYTETHIGYEGYGTFMQGANPVISVPNYLITKDPIKDSFNIYIPENTSGKIPIINASNTFTYATYTTSETSITYNGLDCNINRINCTKYGIGHKITFVNRLGALQDLWFFLKSVRSTDIAKETYNSNTLITSSGTATYSVNAPTKTVYNKLAKTKVTLSSGYYPEGANHFFEELLISEQIWLTQPNPYDLAQTQVVPVIISSNSFTMKTSLNDKLIEYTMDFEMAFDYINNVR